MTGSSSLGRRARSSIADPRSIVFVSAATIWEAMVKSSLGRLDIGDADLVDEIGANEFEDLAISASHARDAALLAPLHRDPFDRMLIAQARAESLCVVTRDGIFERYGVEILW